MPKWFVLHPLYYQLFHLISIKHVSSFVCHTGLIDLSITLQMNTRLQLIQKTQSASQVHRLRPISELACIPRPHDGAPPESLAGPMRACQPAQYRFYNLFWKAIQQNFLLFFSP